MLFGLITKLDTKLAWIGLGLIALGAIVAMIAWGLTLGSIVGFFLFLVIDGLNCIWTVATGASRLEHGERAEKEDTERIRDQCKDNPTIK